MNRREFLLAAGGVAGLAGLGIGGGIGLSQLDTRAGSGRDVFRFRSRPDLRPPVPTVLRDGATVPGCVFFTPMGGPGERGLLIMDDAGRPIWVSPSPEGRARLDLKVQTYRGEPVLTWWEGHLAGGHGRGEYVLMDASYRERRRVRAGHGLRGDLHEFQLTPEGTALMTIYDRVEAAGRTVLEGVVQEVDVASGEVVFEWRSLDHVPLSDSYRPVPGTPSTPYDYIHVNSIDVDLDGNLLVSGRHTCAVYKVDRSTGKVLWRLGGKRSQIALGPGCRTWFQHDVRRQPDGTLTIFDNGASPPREPRSRALTLLLDERARRAAVARVDTHAQVLAIAMGNVQRLPDGGVFVGWGTQPYASAFSADGRLVYDLRMPEGAISYRAFRQPWTGRPRERPAVAVAAEGGGARVHASWNGATEVAAWQVHTGPNPAALRLRAAALRSGFETEIPVARTDAYLAVAAVDAAGRELGRSRTVRLA